MKKKKIKEKAKNIGISFLLSVGNNYFSGTGIVLNDQKDLEIIILFLKDKIPKVKRKKKARD